MARRACVLVAALLFIGATPQDQRVTPRLPLRLDATESREDNARRIWRTMHRHTQDELLLIFKQGLSEVHAFIVEDDPERHEYPIYSPSLHAIGIPHWMVDKKVSREWGRKYGAQLLHELVHYYDLERALPEELRTQMFFAIFGVYPNTTLYDLPAYETESASYFWLGGSHNLAWGAEAFAYMTTAQYYGKGNWYRGTSVAKYTQEQNQHVKRILQGDN